MNEKLSNQISKEELFYIAGLLEGEGSFQAYAPGWRKDNDLCCRLQVAATMTDYEPLYKLHTLVGGKLTGPYSYHLKDKCKRKPIWRWALNKRKEVVDFVAKIFPLMSPRRQKQITLMLNYAEKYPVKFPSTNLPTATLEDRRAYAQLCYLAKIWKKKEGKRPKN